MYYLYQVNKQSGKNIYDYKETIKIFGCNNGIIVKMLKKKLIPNQNEEYKWHLNLERDLPKIGLPESAIIIDLKPNAENNLSLYQLIDIFGYSSCGWTPMMWHLKPIYIDEEGSEDEKWYFEIDINANEDIYTFCHVQDGSVKNGKIIGTWVAPRPSSTNSALLWDNTIDYFINSREEIQRRSLTTAST